MSPFPRSASSAVVREAGGEDERAAPGDGTKPNGKGSAWQAKLMVELVWGACQILEGVFVTLKLYVQIS